MTTTAESSQPSHTLTANGNQPYGGIVQIKIDAEFQAIIPPPKAEERELLEESLKAEGCRDRLVVWQGHNILLDGHNRYEICQRLGISFRVLEKPFDTREDAGIWICDNQLGRRNLEPTDKIDLAEQQAKFLEDKARAQQLSGLKRGPVSPTLTKRTDPIDVRKTVAAKAGYSTGTVAKNRVINEAIKNGKAAPAVKEKLRKGETTINKEYKNIVSAEREEKRQASFRKATRALPPFHERYDLRQVSIGEALKQLPAASVDLIITDPPYKQEFLSVYDSLGSVAAHVLKPGSLALVMVGQTYLPQIIEKLAAHLTYHWTLAYLTPGGQAVQQFQRKVNIFWKPVLAFSNGDYAGDWFGDVVRSATNDNDKRFHEWGQSVSGMRDLVARFVKPGSVVFDPFLGGGTTAITVLEANARFIGFDVNGTAIDTVQARLNATVQ